MIVDDHAAFRQVVRALLAGTGAECRECAGGREAVEQYPGFLPDVVLMDIAMKGLDGLGAAAQIRERFPAATIVMLTQYEDPDLRDAARRAGACDYVLKEDLSRLPAILRSHLPSRGRDPHPLNGTHS